MSIKAEQIHSAERHKSITSKKLEASLVMGGDILVIATLLFASVQSLGGGAYTLFMQLLGIMAIEKKDKATAIVHF